MARFTIEVSERVKAEIVKRAKVAKKTMTTFVLDALGLKDE